MLTPLGISSHAELAAGAFRGASSLEFEIQTQPDPVDRVAVTLRREGLLVLQKELPASFRAPGTHVWKWDGFDTSDVLDTRALTGNYSIEVRSEIKGVPEFAIARMVAAREGPGWVDATVDRKKKTIEVELRVDLREGASYGIGALPPAAVQALPGFKALKPTDARRLAHTRVRSFSGLESLALDGIRLYWSRSVNAPGGASYAVSVDPVSTRRNAMDDVSIAYNSNRGWMRSSNPGRVRGVYSLFGNFVPERIAYNVGWIEYNSGWAYRRALDADREFSVTAAHEIGHEILSAYGGDAYSFSHRGSSTVVTQTPLPPAAGGSTYPAAGSIDLMMYYNGLRPASYYSMISASESDVLSLLWLARVRFRG